VLRFLKTAISVSVFYQGTQMCVDTRRFGLYYIIYKLHIRVWINFLVLWCAWWIYFDWIYQTSVVL